MAKKKKGIIETSKDIIQKLLQKGSAIKSNTKETKRVLSAVNPKRNSGIIIPKYCSCRKYSPKSTKGIINTDCRNCGGQKKPMVLN